MKKITLQLVSLFFLLILLQIWLFNHIGLFGFATPSLYIYFLIKLPISMNRNIVILLSAFLGFTIDIFGSTLGLTMTALVITGFLRFYLLKLFTPRDVIGDYSPSFSVFGRYFFLRYAAVITLIHAFLLYTIESFSLFNPLLLFLRIIGSFTLTILLIFAFESINIDAFKK